ncbi:hypothetical protein [Nocardioides sp. W7]|uniref:hypothetical protein n=1 Tax=Nocardioides sp. W7 TaxID=2931390 RepID=UPI001FD5B53C|nr:hypothetical protein [Nocardioides sp. W7]
MSRTRSTSSLGLLLMSGALFAVCFYVLVSLLDVAFGDDLTTALKSNVDNAIVVATVWMIAMWFLRRSRAA